MPLETASTIADLVSTNPVGASDTPAALDDHIRLIKTVLKADALVDADIGTTVQAYDTNTAKLNIAQTWTAAQAFPAGSVSTPSISTAGDANTGIYFPAADTVAVATGGSERMRIDTSGRVGIGTSAPGINLQVGDTTNDTGTVGIRAATSGTGTPQISLLRLGQEEWYIRDVSGSLAFIANSTERMRIDSSGNVTVSSANGGLGYGTGAGGTVTQSTSKSTAVTLNKPTGQITMNNASLAANTTVSFLVNNSLCANADVVNVGHVLNTGTNAAYLIWAQPGAGGFNINVRNISAGSLSEAIVINFAIIKGATS